jgi:hypothetical protein
VEYGRRLEVNEDPRMDAQQKRVKSHLYVEAVVSYRPQTSHAVFLTTKFAPFSAKSRGIGSEF